MFRIIHLFSIAALALSMNFSSLIAQDVEWSHIHDGYYQGYPWASTSDQAGNFYLGGKHFNDVRIADSSISTSSFRLNAYLSKIGTDGKLVWLNTYMAFEDSSLIHPGLDIEAIQAPANGKLWVLARLSGSIVLGEDTLTSRTQTDRLIIRFAQDGTLEWYTHWYSPGHLDLPEQKRAVAAADGSLFLTLNYDDYLFSTEGDTILSGTGNQFAVLRLDPTGNTDWTWQMKSKQYPVAIQDLNTDGQGNVYLAIRALDTLRFAGTVLDRYNLSILKLGTGGVPLWAKSPVGINNSSVISSSIAVQANGAVYIWGDYFDPFSLDNIQIGNTAEPRIRRLYLIKLDQQGTALWGKRFTSNQSNRAGTISFVAATSKLAVSGSFTEDLQLDSIGLLDPNVDGMGNCFIAQADSNGTFEWAVTGEGYTTFQRGTISSDQQGHLNFSFNFNRVISFANTTFPRGAYLQDLLFGRIMNNAVSGNASIPQQHQHHNQALGNGALTLLNAPDALGKAVFLLSPNPSNGIFRLRAEQFTEAEVGIRIMDVKGQVIGQFTLPRSEVERGYTLDLGGNDAGLYFLELRTPSETQFKKIVLIK